MDISQKERIRELTDGPVRFEYPMAQFTSFKVGGPVEAICDMNTIDALSNLIKYLRNERIPFHAMGRCTNILVKDGGIQGVVIRLKGDFEAIEHEANRNVTLHAGSGATIGTLLRYCRKNGLSGLEFLIGIPGTVGGAVTMNAGAFGKEIESKITQVSILNSEGKVDIIERAYLDFSYRQLKIDKRCILLNAVFEMEKECKTCVCNQMEKYMQKRRKTQPQNFPSAGSVFKNPTNDFAGRLIESVGLKGRKSGGAMISEKHANYIVNTGEAKAKDIINLMHLARARVKQRTGIELEPEIRVIGN